MPGVVLQRHCAVVHQRYSSFDLKNKTNNQSLEKLDNQVEPYLIHNNRLCRDSVESKLCDAVRISGYIQWDSHWKTIEK